MASIKVSSDMLQDKIVSRIKELRKKRGETQKILAGAISVTNSVMQNKEQGRTAISLDDLIDIAKHYNVSLDYLCGVSEHTNDREPSKRILEDLKDVFDLMPETMLLDLHDPTLYIYNYLKLKISEPLIKYLRSAAAAQSMLRDGQIEKDFYEDWIKGAQKKFDESFDAENPPASTEFVVLPISDFSEDMRRILEENKFQETRKRDTDAQK